MSEDITGCPNPACSKWGRCFVPNSCWKPSLTPRTDAVSMNTWNGKTRNVVDADFARELEQKLEDAETRNDDLVRLLNQFEAAIRRIATELTTKACCGVDTAEEINPATGEPYGPGGHTGWLLAEEAKKLKSIIVQLQKLKP